MRRSTLPGTTAALVLLLAPCGAAAGAQPAPADAPPKSSCQISMPKGGELDVTVKNHRLLVPVTLNGRPVRAMLDTGSGATLILTSAARRLGLSLDDASYVRLAGAGGAAQAYATTVSLAFAGAEARNMHLLVTGERAIDVDMVIGDDLLSGYDLELDVPHGKVRLLLTKHCSDDDLPYWTPSYSVVPISSSGGGFASIELPVKINGRNLRATLDTGAPVSVATLAAAGRAGVALPEALKVGEGSGVGKRVFDTYVAPIASFEIGGEGVRNTTLSFADLYSGASYEQTGSLVSKTFDGLNDMLLGVDFMTSHHILISPSHGKMFFTYTGGPVFASGAPRKIPAGATPAAATTPAPAAPHTGG